jgi:hypothetical protein
MNKAKPFCIAKREVWEAYKQVKANRGAAGVDGQSIEDFVRDLSNNLYRIWNRMSSGSYFPPPVRRVDIPKGDSGKTRPLGIPTVASCRWLSGYRPVGPEKADNDPPPRSGQYEPVSPATCRRKSDRPHPVSWHPYSGRPGHRPSRRGMETSSSSEDH